MDLTRPTPATDLVVIDTLAHHNGLVPIITANTFISAFDSKPFTHIEFVYHPANGWALGVVFDSNGNFVSGWAAPTSHPDDVTPADYASIVALMVDFVDMDFIAAADHDGPADLSPAGYLDI